MVIKESTEIYDSIEDDEVMIERNGDKIMFIGIFMRKLFEKLYENYNNDKKTILLREPDTINK